MIGIDTSTLNKASVSMHRSTNGVQNAVGRLLNSGNASKSLLGGGDSGGLSMVSRLELRIGASPNLQKVCKMRLLIFKCKKPAFAKHWQFMNE